ncbi:hypothetical protein ACFLZW_06410, partial [Chloroflexota bacterium]
MKSTTGNLRRLICSTFLLPGLRCRWKARQRLVLEVVDKHAGKAADGDIHIARWADSHAGNLAFNDPLAQFVARGAVVQHPVILVDVDIHIPIGAYGEADG